LGFYLGLLFPPSLDWYIAIVDTNQGSLLQSNKIYTIKEQQPNPHDIRQLNDRKTEREPENKKMIS
jgi:hypothetical protein